MSQSTSISRAALVARDAADPLAHFRDCFHIPDNLIYLDGNSLGPLPKRTVERMHRTLHEEWGSMCFPRAPSATRTVCSAQRTPTACWGRGCTG